MKILHKSKRTVPPVAELINKLLNTPQDNLTTTLEEIDSWKWQRSDLNAWIKVLNKFDTVLEDVVREYDIDKLQIRDFTTSTKKLVSEILRFERLLLENSTNRKMYSSYDRLNSLLFTSDLDILVLALNLLLRPSQQYSSQPAVSQALNISTPRLSALAKRWPHLREYGVELVDLANSKGSPEIDSLPSEARDVNFTFYRTSGETSKEGDQAASTASGSGAVNIHLDEQAFTVETAHGPTRRCYREGREEEREKLVIIRLLAIAIFGHTHHESQATSTLFLFEPDLIIHIAELLKVERNIPVSVQTAAIAALDAMARYRSKISEVLASVNAGVNHGILMSLVRKTVNDIADPECSVPHSWGS
ncbi:hypothetical protein MPER_12125 [Moniliophthora perniciosa FA553]|nr:hypothetical protein MPER_12125 [Moniliophthora perniciosa FA553]